MTFTTTATTATTATTILTAQHQSLPPATGLPSVELPIRTMVALYIGLGLIPIGLYIFLLWQIA